MPTALSAPTRVIGIDPGLNVTGYGVVECRRAEVQLLEAGVIRSSPGRHGNDVARRLQILFEGLQEILDEFHPRTMCLEEVYGHLDYPRTSILMGHARGVICLAARLAHVEVVDFAAKRIKQAVTGNGNASKAQVQRAVQAYFGLSHPPRPADVADALAVALCYASPQRLTADGQSLPRARRWAPPCVPCKDSRARLQALHRAQ